MKTRPFTVGQIVIAVDALPKSEIKNGLIYQVYSCEYAYCKGNFFWYVGVRRDGYKSHDRVRPSIFASIQEEKLMSFEKLNEQQPIMVN